jgi:hypothetical protein
LQGRAAGIVKMKKKIATASSASETYPPKTLPTCPAAQMMNPNPSPAIAMSPMRLFQRSRPYENGSRGELHALSAIAIESPRPSARNT